MSEATQRPLRIAPGGRHDIGLPLWTILRAASRLSGGPLPNVLLTLARNRSLFLPWFWLAARFMPYGKLPAADTELVILRVGARAASAYERAHHEGLGAAAGLTADQIAWSADAPVAEPSDAPTGDAVDAARAELIVRATDELYDDRQLTDDTYDALTAAYPDPQQILEFCLLVGHYAGLASMLNVAGTPVEPGAGMHRIR